jgi:hypothetical protein
MIAAARPAPARVSENRFFYHNAGNDRLEFNLCAFALCTSVDYVHATPCKEIAGGSHG